MFCNVCGYNFDERTGVCPMCGWIVPGGRTLAGNPASPERPGSAAPAGHTAPAGSVAGNNVPHGGQNPPGTNPAGNHAPRGGQNPQGMNQAGNHVPRGGQNPPGMNQAGNHVPRGGQNPPGMNQAGRTPAAGASRDRIPTGGIPTAKTPQSLIPTSRVTVSDTDQLKAGHPTQAGTRNGTLTGTKTGEKGKETRAERKEERKNQKTRRVKAKPKHLALKIALLVVLLAGVGVGVFFGIRALKKKQAEEASWKKFDAKDVMVDPDGSRYVMHQLLLRGKEDASEDKIQKLVKEESGEIVGRIPVSKDYQIQFGDETEKADLERIIGEWEKNSLVASVSLHYAYGTQGGFKYADNPWKDDNNEKEPYGTDLEWNIYSPGGNNWAVESVWAPKVWDSLDSVAQYQKTNVGMIDTVFDTKHKDLTDRFEAVKTKKKLSQEQGTDEPVEGNPTDADGRSNVAELYKPYEGMYGEGTLSGTDAINEKRLAHGTHIAGIISAKMDDQFGISGVAQNAVLRAYATSGQPGIDDGYSLTSTFEYRYALSKMFENNIRLVNISMDLEQMDMDDAKWEQLMAVANEEMEYFLQKWIDDGKDFLIVKSAGDEGKTDLGKAFLLGIGKKSVQARILAVGGAECDYNGSTLRGYKTTATTNSGDRIDIYAPGRNVLSDIPGDRTEMRDGTSEAAAFVSGGCALVMGILPTTEMSEVKDILLDNCYYTVEGTDRGYLNLYMATEAAKARKGGGSSSGLKEEMQKEIEENQPKGGTLELTLDAETLSFISDMSKVSVKAENASGSTETGTPGEDGKAVLVLEEGTWKITVEAEGFAPWEKEISVISGQTITEPDVSLGGITITGDEIPDQKKLERLIAAEYYYNYSPVTVSYNTLYSITGILTIQKIEGIEISEGNPMNYHHAGPAGDYGEWYGIREADVLWAAKNIFNMTDEDIEVAKQRGEDHQYTYRGGDGNDYSQFYYHDGYYYISPDGTDSDIFESVEFNSAERRGDRFSISATLKVIPFGESATYKDYHYEMEYKNVDGASLWAVRDFYKVLNGEEIPPEWRIVYFYDGGNNLLIDEDGRIRKEWLDNGNSIGRFTNIRKMDAGKAKELADNILSRSAGSYSLYSMELSELDAEMKDLTKGKTYYYLSLDTQYSGGSFLLDESFEQTVYCEKSGEW